MGRVLGLLLVFGAIVLSQSVAQDLTQDPATLTAVKRLNSTLMALNTPTATPFSVSERLTNDIMLLAENGHHPKRTTVAVFANELTRALVHKDFSVSSISRLTTTIIEVLQSAGTGTFKFRSSVSHAQEALTFLGVSDAKAQIVVAGLTQIGKEVRGPDDLPLAPLK